MRQISEVTGFLADPVKGASTAFAFLFTISSLLHIWQCSKYKSWYSTWPLPCASIIFIASFVCREITAFNPNGNPPFTSIYGLFYTAVFLTSSFLYISLIPLLSTHPTLFPFRPIYLYPIIMCFFSVIISITSQGTSSFFSPDAPDRTVSSGLALLKVSMVMQLFLNVAFFAIVTFFYYRCSSNGIFQQSGERSTKILTITFYTFMAWIVVSDLFNAIQIFLPSSSSAWTTEAYFWVFSATPMLICTALLHILPPAKYFRDISGRHGGTGAACQANCQTNDFELGQNKRWC